MSQHGGQPLRVLICHERFLFRFGADRVFLLIAGQLKARGCHVTLLAARVDREHAEPVSDVIETMPLPTQYGESDFFASRWLRQVFLPRALGQGGYDLVIHGGWPLFAATADLRRLAPRVLFLDHGVVPTFGYPAATQTVLRHLHELRRTHLRHCTHAAGVSRFIVESQTIPDCGPGLPVRVLLNGTDHLGNPGAASGQVPPAVAALRADGHPLLLNLGRFEWGTYKNSQAALEVFQQVRSALPRARLLVLESAENLRLPPDLAAGVVPLGFPDDAALAAIIRVIDLGLSTSLWEGYNLPLVELLRSGTPALALAIGAHAEVVPDPWFLCDDRVRLAARALAILDQPAAARARLAAPAAQAHWDRLTWRNFVTDLLRFLDLDRDSRLRPCP